MYRNIVYRTEDDDNPAGFALSYCLYKLHFIHSINVRPSPSAGLSLFIPSLPPFLSACLSIFRCHQTTPTTAIPIPFFRHPSPSPSWGSAGGELCVGISQKPAPGLLLLLLLL